MEQIYRVTDADIIGGEVSILDKVNRFASRGVIMDDNNNVLMINMTKTGCYKLPGGGMEGNENAEETFVRELKEETGYDVKITENLGYTEEHKALSNFMQVSYCYTGKIEGKQNARMLTPKEQRLGFADVWLPIDEAISLVYESFRKTHDYSTRFILLRDAKILEYVRNKLTTQK